MDGEVDDKMNNFFVKKFLETEVKSKLLRSE